MEAYATLLYDPCIGVSAEDCIKKVEDNFIHYTENIKNLQFNISFYYPELLPTVQLLDSLSSSTDTFIIWGDYYNCMKNNDSIWSNCIAEKRRKAIVTVSTAKFVIEYLSYKIQEKVADQLGTKISPYAKNIIKIREKICLELPRKELEKHNGWRILDSKNGKFFLRHIDWQAIHKIIWEEYFVPGSGLGGNWGYDNVKVIDENKEIIEILKKIK